MTTINIYGSTGIMGSWKTRYMEIKGNILFHYDNDQAECAARITYLEDIEVKSVFHKKSNYNLLCRSNIKKNKNMIITKLIDTENKYYDFPDLIKKMIQS